MLLRLIFSLWVLAQAALTSPINLDLFDVLIEELEKAETQFYEKVHLASDVEVIDLDKKQVNLDDIPHYQLSRRDDFDVNKANHIYSKNPKSVVSFSDTKTVLVPSDDILTDNDMAQQNEYIEYHYKDARMGFEEPYLPVSSCLLFTLRKGSGSVGMTYTVGIKMSATLSGSLEASLGGLISLKYGVDILASVKISYSVSHTCSSKNGTGTRLFARIATVDVDGHHRKVLFDRFKGMVIKKDWQELLGVKYLLQTNPRYRCMYGDWKELQCSNAGMDFEDSKGNVISSYA